MGKLKSAVTVLRSSSYKTVSSRENIIIPLFVMRTAQCMMSIVLLNGMLALFIRKENMGSLNIRVTKRLNPLNFCGS